MDLLNLICKVELWLNYKHKVNDGYNSNRFSRAKKIIAKEVGVLVYFSTPTCNVCKALRPKIMETFSQEFENIQRIYINSVDAPDIASNYNVFAVPTILVFLDGKEFSRESRNVSVAALVEKIARPYKIMSS